MKTKMGSKKAGWVVAGSTHSYSSYRQICSYVHIESIFVEKDYFPLVREGSHISTVVISNLKLIFNNHSSLCDL